MDTFGLGCALTEVERQIKDAHLTDIYEMNQKLEWAFEILKIEQLQKINENLERLIERGRNQ